MGLGVGELLGENKSENNEYINLYSSVKTCPGENVKLIYLCKYPYLHLHTRDPTKCNEGWFMHKNFSLIFRDLTFAWKRQIVKYLINS